MNSSAPLQKPASNWVLVLAWGGFAALAGLYCVALPPHLITGAMVRPAYGWPLFPWFATAFANLYFVPALASMFVLGTVLGFAQPRWWLLLGCLTISLPVFLNGV